MEKLAKFTLPWFIQKYGEELGIEKYKEKNKRTSESKKGPLSSRYIVIDKESFKQDVLSGLTKTDLCLKYKLSPGGSFTSKLKECFGETNLFKIRGHIWYREGIKYTDFK